MSTLADVSLEDIGVAVVKLVYERDAARAALERVADKRALHVRGCRVWETPRDQFDHARCTCGWTNLLKAAGVEPR